MADEIFLTGTAAELVPVREVDDHGLGEPGEMTRVIQGKSAARPRSTSNGSTSSASRPARLRASRRPRRSTPRRSANRPQVQ
jgi:hypothetical protein